MSSSSQSTHPTPDRIPYEELLDVVDALRRPNVMDLVARISAGQFTKDGRIDPLALAVSISELIPKNRSYRGFNGDGAIPDANSTTSAKERFVNYLNEFRKLPPWAQDAAIQSIHQPETTLKELGLLKVILEVAPNK